MRDLSVKGSPLRKSMFWANDSNGNGWNLWLLYGVRSLLLLQLLDHHSQHLDLLHEGCE